MLCSLLIDSPKQQSRPEEEFLSTGLSNHLVSLDVLEDLIDDKIIDFPSSTRPSLNRTHSSEKPTKIAVGCVIGGGQFVAFGLVSESLRMDIRRIREPARMVTSDTKEKRRTFPAQVQTLAPGLISHQISRFFTTHRKFDTFRDYPAIYISTEVI